MGIAGTNQTEPTMKALSLSVTEAQHLLSSQLDSWALARNNYEALGQVCERRIDCGTFQVKVQYNPARIVSTGAKVDSVTLQHRPCFLCLEHLPAEQLRVSIGNDFLLLVNPFPIFPQHWTLPALHHQPQQIRNHFTHLLELTYALRPLVVFYNGPRCGASAPDHMHFQAGNRGLLPIEPDFRTVARETLLADEALCVYVLKGYGREVLVLESGDSGRLQSALQKTYACLPLALDEEEPGMNIVGWYEAGRWVCCIFPRSKHRPSCYYATDEDRLLISPGAVDMAGVLITPRREDYERLTREDVCQVYQEVSLSGDAMQGFISKIKKEL